MRKVGKIAIAIIYTLLLVYIVFFARRRERIEEVPKEARVNMVPIIYQYKAYKKLNPKDPREKRNFAINLGGNIFLFFPFPFLLVAFGSERKGILLSAFVTSFSIEIIQYLFEVGVSDIDDVLLNVAGAYAGLLFIKHLPLSFQSAIGK